MSLRFIALLLLLSIAPAALYAQGECPTIVETALQTASDSCTGLQRNQACYGNSQLDATGRSDTFTFTTPGDMAQVSDIDSLVLSALDTAAETWGIAVFNLQANLPDTLPGQGVTVLLFGDVRLENAVASGEGISINTTANARIRRTPDSSNNNNVIVTVETGNSLLAYGRSEAGDWLLVELPTPSIRGEVSGWVSTQVISSTEDVMSLPVLEQNLPPLAPMQAFYFASTIGDSQCSEVPDSGMVIQTPQGAGTVQLFVNGVSISLGSTIYLTSGNGELRVYVVEGSAVPSAQGTAVPAPAGTFVAIPLDSSGHAPAGVPADPQPYDASALAALPLSLPPATASTGDALITPVSVAPPVPEDEIEAAVADTFAPYGAFSGTWTFTLQGMQATFNATEGFCAGGVPGWTNTIIFTEAGTQSPQAYTNNLSPTGAGSWLYEGSSDGWTFRYTLAAISPTQLSASLTSTDPLGDSCTGSYSGVWVSP